MSSMTNRQRWLEYISDIPAPKPTYREWAAIFRPTQRVIIGGGALGSELAKQTGWKLLTRSADGIDIERFATFHLLQGATEIINCAAFTDTYSTDSERAMSTNVDGVHNLIEFCNLKEIKLVHISTDFVYAGSSPMATEEDLPIHAPNWYSLTKLVGDVMIQRFLLDHLIIRLSHKPSPFPFSKAWLDVRTSAEYTPNSVAQIVELVNEGANGTFNIGAEPRTIFEMASKTRFVEGATSPEGVPKDTTMCIDKYKKYLNK
jgi:hypothetical protein